MCVFTTSRFVCVCVVSALCERWCENASRRACVSSASNMREICGTYLRCDTSQNDMSQPCYIRATLVQPAGPFLKLRDSRGKKDKEKKNRACLKLCVVALISPKTKEVCPRASAHAIQKVLNPQGGSFHIHWITPASRLWTNTHFCCCIFKAMREKQFTLISILWAINFYKLALQSRNSVCFSGIHRNPQDV